ncbi:NAD(P)H-binding protein [Nonomuraea basaltis]|uniref:NAD(P)H-binding protein n=1 Tax=Nonomuraea basaltis TaxID=2495887 RepID=UPI00110C5FDA|nr:NAD(P)H-binding protein [Nonomuraea basaltis]TMR95289.1 NAD-dependent epimerase/dehydratase family protein [Nonomuraea basaltis]
MGKILVTGATGNVGRHVVSQLAEAGLEVRALVRDPGRARLPVEMARGDLNVPETLHPALEDVESVFLLWPGFTTDNAAEVVAAIAKHARRVVYLSANVAQLADEPATHYQEIERLIRHSGLGWTFLRPGGFAANTLGWAGQIRQGVVRWPYGQAARSLIHEKDIAAVAVHVLTSAGHNGATYVLTGPERLTQAEQVRVIGEVVGREVRWEEQPPEEARDQLMAAWGDADFVDAALKTWESFVTTPEPVTDTVERLLGRPALTFRQWAEDHAADLS